MDCPATSIGVSCLTTNAYAASGGEFYPEEIKCHLCGETERNFSMNKQLNVVSNSNDLKCSGLDILLDKINVDLKLRIERHPSYSPLTYEQACDTVGFKLHQVGEADDRVMCLILDCHSGFSSDGQIERTIQRKIENAIKKFWSSNCTERRILMDLS
jgi:hypothetical protein